MVFCRHLHSMRMRRAKSSKPSNRSRHRRQASARRRSSLSHTGYPQRGVPIRSRCSKMEYVYSCTHAFLVGSSRNADHHRIWDPRRASKTRGLLRLVVSGVSMSFSWKGLCYGLHAYDTVYIYPTAWTIKSRLQATLHIDDIMLYITEH